MATNLRTYGTAPMLFFPWQKPMLITSFSLCSSHCPPQQPWVAGQVSGTTLILPTDFQQLGRLMSISYLEHDHGPTVENRWSITVKSKSAFTRFDRPSRH